MKPELSGEITGLDINLIKNFSILLRTLSSGYDINYYEFEKLCSETKTLYINLYPWYYMPVTVHKILVHSTEVITTCLLPIGQLSEESQEARNKDFCRFREHHTRKNSRICTNIDLLNMLLVTSDPLINSHREFSSKKTGKLPLEVLNLIIPPIIPPELVENRIMCDDEDYLESDSSGTENNNDSSDNN